MVKIIRYVTLCVELEKDVPVLGKLIAQRAYTIDGVSNAEECSEASDEAPVRRDPYVEAVRAKLLSRSQAGIQKYGTDLTRTDLDGLAWLNHFQEELLDAANYVEVLISKQKEKQNGSDS